MNQNPLMQYSVYQLVNLLTPNMVTIEVQFKRDQGGLTAKEYKYKAPVSMGIKVGDEVIVDSPSSGFVVTVVTKVDEIADIDYQGQSTYKWVVQKVDPTDYQARREKELAAVEHLKKAKASIVRDAEIANIKAAFGQLPPSVAAQIVGGGNLSPTTVDLGSIPDSTKSIGLHAFQQAELILNS